LSGHDASPSVLNEKFNPNSVNACVFVTGDKLHISTFNISNCIFYETICINFGDLLHKKQYLAYAPILGILIGKLLQKR
jgi:hypothetical protein